MRQDVLAVERHSAPDGPVDAEEQAQERGLASPVRADDAQQASGLQRGADRRKDRGTAGCAPARPARLQPGGDHGPDHTAMRAGAVRCRLPGRMAAPRPPFGTLRGEGHEAADLLGGVDVPEEPRGLAGGAADERAGPPAAGRAGDVGDLLGRRAAGGVRRRRRVGSRLGRPLPVGRHEVQTATADGVRPMRPSARSRGLQGASSVDGPRPDRHRGPPVRDTPPGLGDIAMAELPTRESGLPRPFWARMGPVAQLGSLAAHNGGAAAGWAPEGHTSPRSLFIPEIAGAVREPSGGSVAQTEAAEPRTGRRWQCPNRRDAWGRSPPRWSRAFRTRFSGSATSAPWRRSAFGRASVGTGRSGPCPRPPSKP